VVTDADKPGSTQPEMR